MKRYFILSVFHDYAHGFQNKSIHIKMSLQRYLLQKQTNNKLLTANSLYVNHQYSFFNVEI